LSQEYKNAPLLVAEAGCNHMGDINIAKQMIHSAKLCCADYIKFQKRCPDLCVPDNIKHKPHIQSHNSFGETYLEHRLYLEFTIDQHRLLKQYCDQIGIKYACSVWDIVSADEIISLDVDYIKIPSAMNNNFELIKYVYQKFNNGVHISLGMATTEEIKTLIDFIKPNLNRSVLYWTTSGYPVNFNELFLLELQKLHQQGIRTGFSGHHLGIAVDIAAFVLGAQYIERHFTLDRTLKGTDQAASLEPAGLTKLQRDLKATYDALKFKNQLTKDEMVNRQKLRISTCL
jgi:N-acetylneuraminate synthase